MKRLASILLALVLLGLGAARADTGDVLVRMHSEPAEGAVIGQPVRILVEVLFKDGMPHPPSVELRDVPGAQIMRFETQGVTIRDRIGQQAYVGQRFEFVLFPRQGGTFVVPGAQVRLLDSQGEGIGALRGEDLRLPVRIPGGVDPSRPVLAADSVTVTQQWEPVPGSARLEPGGAVTRSITRKAAGVPAMAMNNFAFTAPAGVRVYVDPPRVEDRVGRGDVEGVRVDKVTYVFEQPGNYDLQALEQSWWDLAEAQVRNETLKGARFVVMEASATLAGHGSGLGAWRWPLAIGAGLAAAVFLAGRLARHRIAAAWRLARERHLNSEIFAWRELRKAAGAGKALATYRTVRVWMGRLPPEVRKRIQEDDETAALLRELDQVLFGGAAAWPSARGAALAGRLGRLRTARGQRSRPLLAALPPLNPPSPEGEGQARSGGLS